MFVIALALVWLPVSAQTKSFRAFYEKYSVLEGYTTIDISGAMLNAIGAGEGSDSDTGDIGPLMDNIKGMMIVITESATPEFAEDVRRVVHDGKYVPMTTVNDGSRTSQFYSVQKNGKISEFLMTVLGEGDNVVMSISGSGLDVSQVTQFAKGGAGED